MPQADADAAPETPALLRFDPTGDVAVALRPLAPGERLDVAVAEPIPLSHKMAQADLKAGAIVGKYGWPLGRLTASTGFDAGTVLDQGFDRAADALIERIVAVAGGAPTAAERADERDIAIWKRGVTL